VAVISARRPVQPDAMDLAFLDRARYERHGHADAWCMVRWPGPGPSVGELRVLVRDRLDGVDRFGLLPSTERRPLWKPGGLDVDRSVTSIHAEGAGRLMDVIAEVAARPVGSDGLFWQISLVTGLDGEHAILIRAHHAVFDGGSGGWLLRRLFGDADVVTATRAAVFSRREFARGLRIFTGTCFRPAGLLPFNVPVGNRRCVRELAVPRGDFAAIITRSAGLRPTVNDVYLAAMAGGLRMALIARGSRLPRRVYAGVPVNCRSEAEASALGNHFIPVRFPLPIHEPDPGQRLRQVTAHRKRLLTPARIRGIAGFIELAARLPGFVRRAVFRYGFSPRHFNLVCTNLVGLISVPGATVTAASVIIGRQGLTCALSASGDRLVITISASAEHSAFADELTGAVSRSLRELADTVMTEGGRAEHDKAAEFSA
jgi:diacylglycerol O-acyltransferase / wax synthase